MEEEKIYIVGHKNPDTDSICSAVAYAYLKNKSENTDKYIAARQGKINSETHFIFKYFNFMVLPHLVEDGKGKKLILVDHNEKAQSPYNIENADVLEVIDHHNVNFSLGKPIFFITEPIGCTAPIILDIFKKKNIQIPKYIAGLMFSSIISDTLLFKSPTTTEKDKIAAEELEKIAGIDDMKSYAFEMFAAKARIEKKTAEEIINNDLKEYDFGSIKGTIGQIELFTLEKIMKRKEELLDAMKKHIKDTPLEIFILMVTSINEEYSDLLIVGENAETKEKIASAFGKPIKNNVVGNLKGVLSRKKQVVPVVERIF
ncbi:MAG: manganese-dependent inorganic pyrophosphatase [Candidatus Nanohalarchaeota archaeon]|nr:MAG: manganese-dependent inorganic pyrophosphatase [Candidatus Nanohaloarchaeota archaeon]